MSLTDVRLDPPIRRSAAVVYGTNAMSSSLVEPDEPEVASTPTTCSGTPLTVTVWPMGLVVGNSSLAVVAPSTVTAAVLFSSAWVRNRPEETVRARTPSHAGVVPTTEVVQLEFPATSVADDDVVGATAAMSGATI